MTVDHLRFHRGHQHLNRPFGPGGFGAAAEVIARLFGTPQYLLGQSAVVVVWVIINVAGVVHFDLYPFILLNLAFSLQAAYAAPLILLAQTRQAERDKLTTEADARHREELSQQLLLLLQQNTELTRQVERLTGEIHQKVV
ncbi:MAG: DUF1003 domain-containing protein [Dehalococcoidia bacterium]